MTLDEWIVGMPEEDREGLCAADGWRAGAEAMLLRLKAEGLVDKDVYYDFNTLRRL